ncbi:MAG: hypothetical protein JNL38_40295 [Myxococcales bacterium]|nr:hypothetical protein [Myxococcales bacterium]
MSLPSSSLGRQLLVFVTGLVVCAPILHCVGDDPVVGGASSSGDAGGSSSGGSSSGGSSSGGSSSGGSSGSDAGDAGDVPPPSTGKTIWSKIYPKTSTAGGMAADAAGNAYVAMRFSGNNVDFGGKTLSSTGDDMALVKLDPNGVALWAVPFASDQVDLGMSVTVDGAGSVFVAGQFNGLTLIAGPPGSTKSLNGTSGNGNGYVAKVRASDGGVEWLQGLTGNAGTTTRCTSIAFGGGKIGVGCETSSPSVNVPGIGAQSRGAGFAIDLVVMRLDPATGAADWVNRLGGSTGGGASGDERMGGVGVGPTGDVVVAGTLASPTLSDTKASISVGKVGPAASSNVFVVRLAGGTGQQIWTKLFSPPAAGPGFVISGPIAVRADSVYTTGTFGGQVDFKKAALSPLGTADAYALGLDLADGQTRWVHRIGGTASSALNEIGMAVAIDRWGQVVFGGQHMSPDAAVDAKPFSGTLPTVEQPSGGSSFFLVKCSGAGDVLYAKSFAPAVTSDASAPSAMSFAQDGSLRITGYLQGTVTYDGVNPLASEVASPNQIMLSLAP